MEQHLETGTFCFGGLAHSQVLACKARWQAPLSGGVPGGHEEFISCATSDACVFAVPGSEVLGSLWGRAEASLCERTPWEPAVSQS